MVAGMTPESAMPLYRLIKTHVLAAERLHGDDTTVPVMAKVKTDTARLWVYVRDDRPFAGADPPAALFHYSRDRRGEHPRAHLSSWSGILQADAYGGYGELYASGRMPAPVLEAGCFAHARRKFFELADVASAARKKSRGDHAGMIYPIALEAVQRIDALFDIERGINGKDATERLAVRRELSAPLIAELHAWLTTQLARLSCNHDLAKAINYMLRRWNAFTRFLEDGQVCLTTDGVEKPQASSGRRFSRLLLPSCYHTLVGVLSAHDVSGFQVPDLLDPVVPSRTRLAVRPRSSRHQLNFAQLHRRERWPRICVFRSARQYVPNHHCKLAGCRDGSGSRTALFLHSVEEGPERPRRRLRRPGRLNQHLAGVGVALLRDTAMPRRMIA